MENLLRIVKSGAKVPAGESAEDDEMREANVESRVSMATEDDEGNGDDVDMAGFDFDDDEPMADPTLVRCLLQFFFFASKSILKLTTFISSGLRHKC
jgi:hypothetical protein